MGRNQKTYCVQLEREVIVVMRHSTGSTITRAVSVVVVIVVVSVGVTIITLFL